MSGKIYIIPNTLGNVSLDNSIPANTNKIIQNLEIYIVENKKSAIRFIKNICPEKSTSKLKFLTLSKLTDELEISNYLNPCLNGQSIGLLSDAGCPAIADPGSEIIRMAHERKIKIIPLVGPSSVILGMMSSGMNGQNFAFNGYLPINKLDRKLKLKKLEKRSYVDRQAQIFIETPYRNNSILKELCNILNPNTELCIASDLTLPSERIYTKQICDWKNYKIELNKKPTIFIIQKN